MINKEASPFSHRPAQPPLWTFSSLRTWQLLRPLQLRRSAQQLQPGRLGSYSCRSGWPIQGWKKRTRGESRHLMRLPMLPGRALRQPAGPPGQLPPAGVAAVAAVAGQPRRQPERPEWSRPVTKDGYQQLFKVSMIRTKWYMMNAYKLKILSSILKEGTKISEQLLWCTKENAWEVDSMPLVALALQSQCIAVFSWTAE